MRNPTPFFAAFAPLLFGRPPRSFRTALRQSVLKADSLSQWRAAFASMIPDSLLAPKKKGAGSRERLFSPLVTFWAFLSQVLSPNSACREAVRKVQAWWMLRCALRDVPGHQRLLSGPPEAFFSSAFGHPHPSR